MRFFILISALVFSLGANAQNLETDLKRINQNYALDSFNAQYLYQFTINGKIQTNENVQIQRQGDFYYAKTNDVVQIGDKKKTITIYKNQKLMVLANSLSQSQNPYEVDLKSALDQIDSSRTEQDSAHQRIYRLFYKKHLDYDELVLCFNPKTGKLSYLELVERQGADEATLRINYRSFDQKIKRNLFSADEFATMSNNNLILKSKYKNYKVIDNRITLKK